MNAPACSRLSTYFHSSSSRPAKYGTKRFLGGTALLLSLLVIGPSALAQTPLTPSTLSFGNQVINQASAPMSATFKNTQTTPLSISIAISSGTAPADYVLGGNCPASPSTLGPGQTCNITVTFTPSAPGMRTATLTVTDDAATSPLTVALTGTGVAPVDLIPSSGNFGAVAVANPSATQPVALTDQKNLAHGRPLNPGGNAGLPVVGPVGTVPSPISVSLPGTGSLPVSVSPASLTFASGAVGTTSGTQTVTLTNHQNTSLTVSAAVATGDFAVASNTCGSSVAPGRSCTVGVTFRPMAMGSRTGTLTLPYSAAGSPSVIALSGSGNAEGLLSIAVTPANPSISSGQTQQFTATGIFSDGITQNLTTSVLWSSSKPGVATINAAGLATSVSAGSTTIVATYTPGGLAARAKPDSVIITPPSPPTLPPPISSVSSISGSTTLTVTSAFVSTGSLSSALTLHTATLLDNGLVLIAGGANSSGSSVNTAELYNPTTGTFTPTGSLNTGRMLHTATLLPNGMVLIAGGYVGTVNITGATVYAVTGGPTASAELYNPATGTFTSTGSLVTGRDIHTATLLSNGLVLLTGGQNTFGQTTASAELYDPATGSFTATGSMSTVRYWHSATALNDGTVLIVGGYSTTAALATAELYNPVTGAFSVLASGLSTGVFQLTTTLLNNGMVLVAGGANTGGYPITNAELYNPADQTFTPTGSLMTARCQHTATLLTNGQVLLAGGSYDLAGDDTATAELYNPDTGTFASTSSLNFGRYFFTATLLDNGQVLMAGGLTGNAVTPTYLSSAELYDPATLTPANLVSISLAPTNPSIPLDSALRFTAYGTFSGGNVEQLAEVTWSSSNPGVISVSNDASDPGEAYAAATGSATISACAGTVCGSATTTVGPPGPTSATGTAAFAPTGTMTHPPAQATATLLNNGWVLIAGGQNPYDGYEAYAQLYNPATGAFAPTANLNYSRSGHTATLLSNGLVLIVGGVFGDGLRGVAELYNPVTGTFTPTGSLITPRAFHTATLLPNGKVLIAGGNYISDLTSAELYDPISGTFAPTGSMHTARDWHTATLLNNGMVLIAGGGVGGNYNYPSSTTSAELYNPATGTFTPTGSLGTARVYHTATLLNNGMVLVAGGSNGFTDTNTAELYNPFTGTFTPTGNLNYGRTQHTATLLNNGLVLVAGGDTVYSYVPIAELYDPIAGVFTSGSGLNTPRAWFTATLLNNGSVLIGGGDIANYPYTAPVSELYLPGALTPSGLISVSVAPTSPTISLGTALRFTATGTFSGGATEQLAEVTWTSSNPGVISVSNDSSDAGSAWAATAGSATISACAGVVCGSTTATVGPAGPNSITGSASFSSTSVLNVGRAYHTATLLNSGLVLIAGGQDDGSGDATNTAELYDPTAGTFTPTGNLTTARYYHTATLLNNGMVLIVGGYGGNQSDVYLTNAELYNPATGTFTPTGSLNTARQQHTTTLLPNGQVLIAGGYGNTGTLRSAEIYDPTSGTFTVTAGSMETPRYLHTATLLPNGMVLMAGGLDNGSLLNTAELYNPATISFIPTGDLTTYRALHSATLLNNGLVLIAGGFTTLSPAITATAELYNPASGTFTATTGTLNYAREFHTATLLTNGRVLIAGGDDGSVDDAIQYVFQAELYDPASQSFSPSGSLSTPLEYDTATLLTNGTVLFTGGIFGKYGGGVTTSAELYAPATLTPANLLSISIAPASPTIPLATGMTFIATGTFSGGNSEQLAEVIWTSSNPGVISISNDASNAGAAWAATAGSATISACAGEVCGSTTATVGPAGPNSITGTSSFAQVANTMFDIRAEHTATLLPNGQVLLAGGDEDYEGYSAELYDPAAKTFTPTGFLNYGRYQATATLLNNGQVLIVGGYCDGCNGSEYAATAELYNPATGVFTLTGILNVPRAQHTATLLPNGQVLIAGGYINASPGVTATAELYDPVSGTFTLTGSMLYNRVLHTATLLPNGQVLMAGGDSEDAADSTELYNPATGAFTYAAELETPRWNHTATLLNNGQVLLAGGRTYSDSYVTATAELYDPFAATPYQEKTTYTLGSLNNARELHTATLLNNGLVLIAGGDQSNLDSNAALSSAELYNPATQTFSNTGSLTSPREYDTATLLNNGSVLFAGGTSDLDFDAVYETAELYSPATLTPSGLVAISLAPADPTISLGTATRFTATGTFSGGSSQQLAEVTWSSSNPGVISVGDDSSNAGAAWAATTGSATITACAGEVCGSTTATVGPAGPNSLTGSGSFGAAGNMINGRQYQTATLLPNGQVLVAGGADSDYDCLPYAELYDPTTGSFTATGNLHTGRFSHTATLLNNGLVLITGGYYVDGTTNTAELYNPATGTFTPTGNMKYARVGHTATLLNNGQVLIAGGYLDSGFAEIYDPTTGTFALTGSLNVARENHTATLLDDGTVLIAAGFGGDGALNSAELYSPATGTFTELSNTLKLGRFFHTATLLNNGQVLLAGGELSSNPYVTTSAELYNPLTQTFTYTTGSMDEPRYYQTATLLTNGLVLVAGGCPYPGGLACDYYPDYTADLYDPASGTFAVTNYLNASSYRDEGVAFQTATLLNNGQVLLAGGSDDDGGDVTNTTELYSPVTLTPQNLVSISLTPVNPTIPLGTAQRFIATGTFNGGNTEELAEVTWTSSNPGAISISDDASDAGSAWAATTGSATITACAGDVCGSTTAAVGPPGPDSITGTASFASTGSLNLAREGHTATLLNDGLVLIAGGLGTGATVLGTAEIYNPSTGTFTATENLNQSRYGHTATLLNNGLVLIAGGCIGSCVSGIPVPTASAELYNPATGAFLPTGNLNAARTYQQATLLNNGTVLIAGGVDGSNNPLASAELYDPSSGTFTLTGSFANAREFPTATLLNDGTVLMAGGQSLSGSLATAELYNPASGTFTLLANGLSTARYLATATLLNNGLVLIAGGRNSAGPLNTAELYNPATQTFTLTGSLNTAREEATATLLNNGRVLIAGGTTVSTPSGAMASAELYDPASGAFTPAGSLTTPRVADTATLLKNGMVLMVGGDGGSGPLSSAELYDPATLTPPDLVSIAIAPGNPTVPLGSALRFSATGTFSGGNTQQLAEATWTSSNPGVISISDDLSNQGAAWAAAAGSATITACAGAVCGSTTATVGPPGPNSITGTAAFASTGNLNPARDEHTATLLNNGLVLIAGGLDSSGAASNSAELYNPTTGAFTPTGNLTTARYDHTATLLNNGMVLIAGGCCQSGGSNALASAELYDPTTGTFTATASLNNARDSHTATLLNNGMVLIAGGYNFNGSFLHALFLSSAELYNPATGTFSYTTGNLNTGRATHTATLLNNGMVVIAGGDDFGASDRVTALASAELYDPTTGTFTATGNLHTARDSHTATMLNNGLVLLAGGSPGPLNSAELYNPASGTFSYTTGGLNTARYQHTATLLTNGLVLVAGGQGSSGDLASTELYDPASGSFAPTGSLTTARDSFTATLLNNGTVLMAGGENSGSTLNSAELYDPATLTPPDLISVSVSPANPTVPLDSALPFTAMGTFSGGNTEQLAAVTWSSSNPASVSVSNDASNSGAAYAAASGSATITACAGTVCGSTTATVGPLGPGSITGNAAFGLTASLNTARFAHTATLLNNGLVLIAGGVDESLYSSSSAEIYNPTAGTFTPTGSMNATRSYHTATLLSNGMVLIVGGLDENENDLATAELYNPATGTFTLTGSLTTARDTHTATLLPNGLVLIAGGEESGGALSSAELYDPAIGTFSLTGNMANARVYQTATLLNNGLVLIAGDAGTSAELYNPATGTFSATGNLVTYRYAHTATLLNNGMVLMAGGYGTSGFLNSAELYNPATGTFANTGSLATARDLHTATLLNNGLVLMAGGQGSSSALNSAEVYDPATGSFGTTGSLSGARFSHTATLLNNGQVLMAGGAIIVSGPRGNVNVPQGNAELYDPGTLTPPNLVSISLAPGNPTIPLGSAQTFIATGTFSGGNTEQLAEVTWTSSDPGVVNVSDDASNAGAAYAAAAGSTTISACAGTVCGSTTATVGPPGPKSITGTAAFASGGNLNTARFAHTATLLNNGLVLIAGGVDESLHSSSSAEIYDPTAGTFTPTGSMNATRSYHTATLLSNGMVLIVGGLDENGNDLATAELYNPATGTFTLTGSLTTARDTHTATLLPNGLVLIAGGETSSGTSTLKSAELYNPVAGSFSLTGNMADARVNHTATLLPSGLVLIAGDAGTSAELYNPASGTFSLTGNLVTYRYAHTATLLNNGLVLLAGGYGASGFLNSAELYNPATGTFASTGSLATARDLHTTTLLNNGLVLMAGGQGSSSALNSAEVYDPTTGTFGSTGSLSGARFSHTATLLSNGLVLMAGGAVIVSGQRGNVNVPQGSAELYDPATLTPPDLVSISVSPGNPTVPLGSAQTFTATGTFSGGNTEQLASVTWTSSNPGIVSISDDASNTGAAYAATTGSATISACAGAVCGSTKVTVGPQVVSIAVTPANGAVAPGSSLQFIATGTFSDGTTQNLTSSVIWSSSAPSVATIARGGLATGVSVGDTLITAALAGAEGSATLSVMVAVAPVATGSLTTARVGHTATLIGNIYVLIAGGFNSSGSLATAEVFNSTDGMFSPPLDTLNTARYNHTATLLNNGMVLLAGGLNSSSGQALATAELYDPARGTFNYTAGTLNTARYSHTATLLSNGMVLLAGGYNSNGALASAELYDPTTETFMPTGSLKTARYQHTATLLSNGTVLIAGGTAGYPISDAELYDPATGAFALTGSLDTARELHTATLLSNGQVLIAGGFNGSFLSSAELYDPVSEAFTPTSSLNTARDRHTAALLNNGLVLISAGENSSGFLASEELYNPSTGAFTFTGSLTSPRGAPTATLLAGGSGHVLIAGGYNSSGYLSGADLYEPATLTPPDLVSIDVLPASFTIALGETQRFIAMGNFGDGSQEQLGGVTWTSSNTFRAQISNDVTNPGVSLAFAPGASTITATVGSVSGSATLTVRSAGFVDTGSMDTRRVLFTATLLNNGMVLVAGGDDGDGGLAVFGSSAELYNPATGFFTATGSLNVGRFDHTATLLQNGQVLIEGGGALSPASELYDPASGTFTLIASPNTPRVGATATLLKNGMVLIAGGVSSTSGNTFVAPAELYNPATQTFTVTGSLNIPRDSHTATLLPSGRVLIAGGTYDSTGDLAQYAELYDPDTGTFTLDLNQMVTPRAGHTATLLNNGMVLLAGGIFDTSNPPDVTASAELYNPATGLFTATGNMVTARVDHTATLLNNGTVLLVGGESAETSGNGLQSSEVYDPGSGTFTPGSMMDTVRAAHTATLLSNGMVLIAGGTNGSILNSAELY